MAAKTIYFENQARDKILSGIIKTAKAATKTLGPRGRLVAIGKGIDPKFTKDGISVIKEIQFADPQEEIGHQLIQEASNKVAFLAGDGTTSTAVLTQKLCAVVNNLIKIGVNINDIKSGLDSALEKVDELLPDYKHTIGSYNEIYNIAKISANNDNDIAENVQKAFSLIGDGGIVTLADSMSRKGETQVVYSDGGDFNAGWTSSHFCNTEKTCELDSPLFLIFKNPIKSKDELTPFVESAPKGSPLVVIAPDFDDETLMLYTTAVAKRQFNGCLIFTPGNSVPEKEDRTNDIAVMLNAHVVGTNNLSADNYSYAADAGTCEHASIQRGKTVISGAKPDKDSITKYIESLKKKINNDSVEEALSEHEIESIKERLAHMTGGVATIYVGAFTQPELQEKKDRYEDALCAVRAAMGDGIVPGAGSVLFRIGNKLANAKDGTLSIGMAQTMNDYFNSLSSITNTLISSTEKDLVQTQMEILKSKENMGFDARSGNIVDLLETGIMDPYSVVYYSILYATKTAKLFAQIDCSIVTQALNLSADKLNPIFDSEGILDGNI